MASPNEELEKYNWHWRNTMRPVRFFNFDARAALPWAILLVYARWSTLILAILATLLFWALERSGLTMPAALRTFRTWINGQYRPMWLKYKHRKWRDYG